MKYKTIKNLLEQPLSSKAKCKTLLRFVLWGIKKRLLKKTKFTYTFIEGVNIIVRKNISTSELQYYCGLSEFYEMGFLVHFLRKDDTFVDVGANIGSYTLLASGYAKAKTIAFEPIPQTFNFLKENCQINNLEKLTTLHNMGVSEKEDKLVFTSQQDAINHVVRNKNNMANNLTIKTNTLDNMLNDVEAIMLKIDVEGYETKVIEGAQKTLSNNSLCAVVVELNGLANRYGFDESMIHHDLVSKGFKPYTYEPFKRSLVEIETYGNRNTLYLRNLPIIMERLQTAPQLSVFGITF